MATLQTGGLAHRYAAALFGAARGRGREDAVAEDLDGLRRLDERDPTLRRFLESPEVRDDHKQQLVDDVLGPRAEALTVRFLHLLLQKKRVPLLRDAIEAYRRLIEEHRGLVRARVTSATELPADVQDRLRAALEARTGSKVVLESRVEPELLGGARVQWADKILDDTVRTRLDRVHEELLAAEL